MLPELVKFHDEYGDLITINSVNLTKNPSAQEGFPVQVIPTQFLFDADGKPYVPKNFALGTTLELLTDDEGEHVLTKHSGMLNYYDLVGIFEDMTSGSADAGTTDTSGTPDQ